MKMNIAARFLAVGLLTAGLTASAQDNPDQKSNNRRPPAGARGRALEAGDRPVLGVLTDAQRASMKRALQSQRDRMREINLKLR
jgi:hypothetical protein